MTNAHKNSFHAQQFAPHTWREPRGQQPTFEGYLGAYYEGFRTCSYCGSMHPKDLLDALRAGGVHLSRADMKYGWPHKIYVDIPNQIAGLEGVVYSGQYSGGEFSPTFSVAPDLTHGKFYCEHLMDMDDADFYLLAPYLERQAGVKFEIKEECLYYTIVGPSYVFNLVSDREE